MSIRRIAILHHHADPRAREIRYILGTMAEFWRRRGVEVLTLHGLDQAPEVDLLAPQIDLTVMPEEYRAFIARYPRVLNRAVVDVSKSRFSQLKLRRGDAWDGPVIVKTERNYGGRPEERTFRAADTPRKPDSRIANRVQQLVHAVRGPPHPLDRATVLDSRDYPVFDSIAEVPPGVWRNPALLVERFVPELTDRGYCLRNYLFCGSRGIAYRRFSSKRLVKSLNQPDRERIDVPDEILAARERLGFDYGKFDFVMHEGRAVLLDVNATPTWVKGPVCEQQLEFTEELAQGLF